MNFPTSVFAIVICGCGWRSTIYLQTSPLPGHLFIACRLGFLGKFTNGVKSAPKEASAKHAPKYENIAENYTKGNTPARYAYQLAACLAHVNIYIHLGACLSVCSRVYSTLFSFSHLFADFKASAIHLCRP